MAKKKAAQYTTAPKSLTEAVTTQTPNWRHDCHAHQTYCPTCSKRHKFLKEADDCPQCNWQHPDHKVQDFVGNEEFIRVAKRG